MILKIIKAVWFLSVLAVLADLLYVYAALPSEVVIQQKATGSILASREFLFYGLMGLLAIINALVFLIRQLYDRDKDFITWFYGLIITVNVFFIFAMSLIQVFNSAEIFDFSRVGVFIYGSIALMVVWALGWPAFVLFRKISTKQSVSQF